MTLHDDYSGVGGDDLDRSSCADMPIAEGPKQDIRLHVDSEQIGRFVRGMFAYADPETYLSFRAFEERTPDAKPIVNSSIPAGHEGLIEEVVRLAQCAADHDRPTVVCPPLATFNEAGTAKGSDLANGLVLSVECDVAPAEARRALEAILGPATFVVRSGGIWTDPATGELVDKLHLHWRLSEPTSGAADHATLREARRLATQLAGADPSNVPIVHPIRWPGTWHRKSEPRMACIVTETKNEIELADALECLREVAEARGISTESAVTGRCQPLEQRASGSVPPSRVKAALRFIGGWDDRKTWIDVGIYVKAALGDAGYDLWAEWSAQSQKFDNVEAQATWATFSPTRTGGGQLFQMAEAAGWCWTPMDDGVTIDLQAILRSSQERQHQRRMEAEQAEAAAAGGAAANDDAPEPLEESDSSNSPGSTAAGDALPEPVGLVREIRDHILATARSPQPELALAAALMIVSSAMARRYRFENLRSNLYLVGVAPSASGKEVPLSAIARILGDAGLANALAVGEPKSGAAVLSRLAEHPVAVYTLDEFGMLLRALTDTNGG
jgi:hypothetical protein